MFSFQFKCIGQNEVTEKCNEDNCPSLTPWTEWSKCSASCGGGTQKRIRECLLSRNALNDNPCKQSLEEQRNCNENVCPKWTDWTEWSECSASCDGGFKSRIRECTLPRNLEPSQCGGSGERNQTVPCNENPCPTWAPWSEWSECSATCGGGSQHRARECITPTRIGRNGELSCEGSAFEDRQVILPKPLTL